MDTICQIAIETFGETNQINKAIEELNNLINALIYWKNGHITKREINEDIAACYIMLVQLCHIFIDEDNPQFVKQMVAQKLEKLERRIEACQQSISTE